MQFELSDIFFVLVIFQLLFFSFFLFTLQKGKRMSHRLLGAFLFVLGLNLTDVFLLKTGFYFRGPSFALWGGTLPLLFGPLLYFYARSVLYAEFRLKLVYGWHLLPFLLLFLFSEAAYLSRPTDFQLKILQSIIDRNIPFYVYITSTLVFIHFMIYTGMAIWLTRRKSRLAMDAFSNAEKTSLNWMYSTIVFFVALMVISTLNGFLGLTAWAKYYYIAFNLVIIAIFFFISRVLLKAMQEPVFFVSSEWQKADTPSSPEKVSVSPGPPEEEKQRLLQDLKNYMESRRPYLEPDLTLEQLAKGLSVKPKILSQVINEKLNQNFFDFINRYRIEEAKRLLYNPADKKITVLEVLYEVGFNSKSSFNTLFKKYTGLTPSEFKKRSQSE